ncbi:MAG: AEC family transporter [Clostridia bacterium]|nr:AEC family transporter [Clostridia bacterium]
MEDIIFALNAVMPIILMIAVGYLLKRVGMLPPATSPILNKLVFRVFLPAMLFLNIYKIESFSDFDPTYIFYTVGITLALFIIGIPVICAIAKDNGQRGSLLQSVFRPNYALIGIPLATSLFGEEGAIAATLLSAALIPIFNILAVICLSVFCGEGKVSVKSVLLGIVKNPLIQGICAGLLAIGARAIFAELGIELSLTDAVPVYKTLEYLSDIATPVALLVLGAQFEFSAIAALKKQIIAGTLMRSLIVPVIGLAIAYFVGCFDGAHFATFVAVFCTPVAVSSVPMAQEMGGDVELAGQLVVWTTLFSGITIFLASYILKVLGIFF